MTTARRERRRKRKEIRPTCSGLPTTFQPWLHPCAQLKRVCAQVNVNFTIVFCYRLVSHLSWIYWRWTDIVLSNITYLVNSSSVSSIGPFLVAPPGPNRAWLLVVHFSRQTSRLSVYQSRDYHVYIPNTYQTRAVSCPTRDPSTG